MSSTALPFFPVLISHHRSQCLLRHMLLLYRFKKYKSTVCVCYSFSQTETVFLSVQRVLLTTVRVDKTNQQTRSVQFWLQIFNIEYTALKKLRSLFFPTIFGSRESCSSRSSSSLAIMFSLVFTFIISSPLTSVFDVSLCPSIFFFSSVYISLIIFSSSFQPVSCLEGLERRCLNFFRCVFNP